MRIYLTGATGYIGSALARRLRAEGHEVRALVRPTSDRRELEQLGVHCFAGDLADRVSLREGMSGADWVVHAGAELDLAAAPGRMELANVQGSENVASLAYKLGVPRFLSISSVARFGGSPEDGSLATEESPPLLPFPTRYAATKAAGEEAIQAWARQGLRVVTVYPALVYGPPPKRRGANSILAQIYRGRFPFLVGADRKSSWVFLEDLVEALLRTLERSQGGERFLLAGDVTTTRELARKLHDLGGAPPPRREISPRAARVLLRLVRPFLGLAGRKPPIPLEQLRSLERHWAFDDSKARDALDWRPRGLEEGLPLALEGLGLRSRGSRP